MTVAGTAAATGLGKAAIRARVARYVTGAGFLRLAVGRGRTVRH